LLFWYGNLVTCEYGLDRDTTIDS